MYVLAVWSCPGFRLCLTLLAGAPSSLLQASCSPRTPFPRRCIVAAESTAPGSQHDVSESRVPALPCRAPEDLTMVLFSGHRQGAGG